MTAWRDAEGSGGAIVPLVALLTGVTVLEGLDLTLASLAAPVLATEWQLSKSGLTPLLAAALVGMTIGALVGSWFADRLGRRPVIITSVVIFAAGTIACAKPRFRLKVLRSVSRKISCLATMMITPFVRLMATIKRQSNGVILHLFVDVHPFPEDVLVLLMVPVISYCELQGKSAVWVPNGSVLLAPVDPLSR